jgi:hypothetical protein
MGSLLGTVPKLLTAAIRKTYFTQYIDFVVVPSKMTIPFAE